MKKAILAGVLLVAGATLAPAVSAQEERGLPVLSTENLVISHYEPQNVDAEELLMVANRLIGRTFYVKERGGAAAAPVTNLQLLGYSLLVYDERESVDSILQSLRSLDGAERGEGVDERKYVTREYRPRFLHLGTVKHVLRDGSTDFSIIEERSLVILRGWADDLEESLALLRSIDVPRPEIRLQCFLLVPAKTGDTSAQLPEGLAQELKTLVPQYEFRRDGFALLHTSVAPTSRVRALLGGSGQADYELSFKPTAFDSESSSLSVEDCSLVRSYGPDHRETVFSTSMVMRGGEYTVLGASGSEPVFVVVRIEPL